MWIYGIKILTLYYLSVKGILVGHILNVIDSMQYSKSMGQP